ncbi:MAG: ABC transporter permease [Candidatus Aminicenantes bacterium]|nr:ABC transporter permease [Candidatus Aminicenantes bacterium]
MIRNYLIVAFRNLRKSKAFSLINIAGLAIGLACAILILLWVRDEAGFDRFHSQAGQIVRLYRDEAATSPGSGSALTSPPMAAALKKDFPEVRKATRFGTWQHRLVINQGKSFTETAYMHADPEFFGVFSFPFIKGDPGSVFTRPDAVVLTESAAAKYFGSEDPMGRVLTVDRAFDVVVTGVIKDPPANSSLKFSLLSPFDLLVDRYIGDQNRDNWGFNSFSTFLLLASGIRADAFTAKLDGYLQRYDPEDTDRLAVQPLTDIHLRSSLGHDFGSKGSLAYVLIFGILAFFVLAIAAMNFMNLATARSTKRAREVGIRKVVGARRSQLIRQFFAESIFMSLLAFAVALVLVEIAIPAFNRLSGKEIATVWFRNPSLFLGGLAIALGTGVFSGLYPAYFLSSFRPVLVLKGVLRQAGGGAAFRKTLVIIQFALSVFLISGTLVISRQMHDLRTRELGFEKERIVHLRLFGELTDKYPALKEGLLRDPNVASVSASMSLPSDIRNSPGTPDWEGKDPSIEFDIRADFVDFDYVEMLGIPILEGRSFSREFASDPDEAYLVNEEAVRRMGLAAPVVGKRFAFWGREGRIIGVMKDAHFQPFRRKIEPLVFKMFPDWLRTLYIKIRPGDITASLASIEKTWASMGLGYPFEYRFLDESFESLYKAESRLGSLFRTFAGLAILVACLGLFGLASFITEQRTREIGIRRILGASISGITAVISREFILCVLAANLIAWPAAWYFMSRWLQGFAYRAALNPWSFILSGLVSLAIALATVAGLSIRAASANPVRALRYE